MTLYKGDLSASSRPLAPIAAIHSPFRYVGGKFWLRNTILPLIPPHDEYLEPFCGGASIFFLHGGEGRVQLNDLDAELMNCFANIRDHTEALIERLLLLSVNTSTHSFIRDKFQPADSIDRAVRYFF